MTRQSQVTWIGKTRKYTVRAVRLNSRGVQIMLNHPAYAGWYDLSEFEVCIS